MHEYATEYSEEVQRYYRDGVLHRDNDLPAVLWQDGSREWWVSGKRMRWDPSQPTEIRCNPSTKNYEVSFSELWHDQDGNLHRDINDLPAVIHSDNTREWWRNGERYREGGLPTVITGNGIKMWHNRQGCLHREMLPAVIGVGGAEWWLNGEKQTPP